MSAGTRILASKAGGDGTVLLKAVGPCSMTCCGALKRFVGQFRKPATTNLYLDLSEADSIDSTFAGFLLSLATKKAHPETPDLHLVQPSPRIVDAIRCMHLTRFFKLSDSMPRQTGDWKEVALERESSDALRNTVIDSHEKLIEADGRNKAEFGRVVDGLRSTSDPNRSKPN